jgi:hypothetical protein
VPQSRGRTNLRQAFLSYSQGEQRHKAEPHKRHRGCNRESDGRLSKPRASTAQKEAQRQHHWPEERQNHPMAAITPNVHDRADSSLSIAHANTRPCSRWSWSSPYKLGGRHNQQRTTNYSFKSFGRSTCSSRRTIWQEASTRCISGGESIPGAPVMSIRGHAYS